MPKESQFNFFQRPYSKNLRQITLQKKDNTEKKGSIRFITKNPQAKLKIPNSELSISLPIDNSNEVKSKLKTISRAKARFSKYLLELRKHSNNLNSLNAFFEIMDDKIYNEAEPEAIKFAANLKTMSGGILLQNTIKKVLAHEFKDLNTFFQITGEEIDLDDEEHRSELLESTGNIGTEEISSNENQADYNIFNRVFSDENTLLNKFNQLVSNLSAIDLNTEALVELKKFEQRLSQFAKQRPSVNPDRLTLALHAIDGIRDSEIDNMIETFNYDDIHHIGIEVPFEIYQRNLNTLKNILPQSPISPKAEKHLDYFLSKTDYKKTNPEDILTFHMLATIKGFHRLAEKVLKNAFYHSENARDLKIYNDIFKLSADNQLIKDPIKFIDEIVTNKKNKELLYNCPEFANHITKDRNFRRDLQEFQRDLQSHQKKQNYIYELGRLYRSLETIHEDNGETVKVDDFNDYEIPYSLSDLMIEIRDELTDKDFEERLSEADVPAINALLVEKLKLIEDKDLESFNDFLEGIISGKDAALEAAIENGEFHDEMDNFDLFDSETIFQAFIDKESDFNSKLTAMQNSPHEKFDFHDYSYQEGEVFNIVSLFDKYQKNLDKIESATDNFYVKNQLLEKFFKKVSVEDNNVEEITSKFFSLIDEGFITHAQNLLKEKIIDVINQPKSDVFFGELGDILQVYFYARNNDLIDDLSSNHQIKSSKEFQITNQINNAQDSNSLDSGITNLINYVKNENTDLRSLIIMLSILSFKVRDINASDDSKNEDTSEEKKRTEVSPELMKELEKALELRTLPIKKHNDYNSVDKNLVKKRNKELKEILEFTELLYGKGIFDQFQIENIHSFYSNEELLNASNKYNLPLFFKPEMKDTLIKNLNQVSKEPKLLAKKLELTLELANQLNDQELYDLVNKTLVALPIHSSIAEDDLEMSLKLFHNQVDINESGNEATIPIAINEYLQQKASAQKRSSFFLKINDFFYGFQNINVNARNEIISEEDQVKYKKERDVENKLRRIINSDDENYIRNTKSKFAENYSKPILILENILKNSEELDKTLLARIYENYTLIDEMYAGISHHLIPSETHKLMVEAKNILEIGREKLDLDVNDNEQS
ncbi:MAG: hypothetical protein HRT47_13865 [Candidatus Caenarcaniphilales bacterium]|nr:hypothetical protein [Candidatus Caenarcaniphilales bacterium]